MIGAIGQRFSLGAGFVGAAILSCFAIPIFEFASRGLKGNETSLAADLDHAGTE
jgi:hypothetical protein